VAGLLKFLPVFFHGLGYDASAIATFLTVSSISSFVGSIVWGRLADKTGGYKQIIMATALISSGVASGFMVEKIQGSRYRLLGTVAFFSLFNRPPCTAPIDRRSPHLACSCTGTLIDSITVLFVKESGAESYGEQRLWAAIGWGVMR
jgi:MFS family permease